MVESLDTEKKLNDRAPTTTMPGGPRLSSKYGAIIGVVCAVIGVLGYFVFGWRFSDPTAGIHPSVGSAIGFVVAIFALGSVLYQRFAK